ncbi:hypothetical protein NUH88_05040 [Nisaea acidiphila]|uniref:Uncharacterized protein n=1 Tax=Nisaea acidiphila TaxID=1862145 RepID=A0A9J7AW83_9PROT|nr:hypothetical protein [Nisaea acidiphila]UUX51058.1 hypothetical protein NUH88_05040 [Nisaea acidiphila]
MAKELNPIDTEEEDRADPLNPAEDTPSELAETTHAEFLAIYTDASANLRYAKTQQWRSVLYFSVGAALVTGYGEWTHWQDKELSRLLLFMVWVFSVASAALIVSLQWWQAAENAKITYVTSKWSSFSTAARKRKSKLMSDIQRYGILIAMILYLEFATIAVTRIFLLKL